MSRENNVCIYQLAPEPDSLMMSYVIVTPNKKVVVIDGGISGVGYDSPPYLPSAIRAILELPENGYFEIDAWFLSHEHNDHYRELDKIMLGWKESDNFKINNIYFDFPEFVTEWKTQGGEGDYDMQSLPALKDGFEHYYSVCGFDGIDGADIPREKWQSDGSEHYYYNLVNGAVINAESVRRGLTINIDGVAFRVLATWGPESRVVNSTSIIVRMTYGEHSVLFLGDAFIDNGDRLLRDFPVNELRSEYVQMAHHGQSGPDCRFYTEIGTKESIRLWPTPRWVWNVYKAENHIKTDVTRSWLELPEDYNEFAAQGLLETGRDFVAGLYKHYPAVPSERAAWTPEVLADQLVAEF